MSKKPSGSQFRKKRLQQETFVESQRDALLSYVHPLNKQTTIMTSANSTKLLLITC